MTSFGPPDPPPDETSAPRCSARGCHHDAAWKLLWNNPKLHTPDRRKAWLACDEHRDPLAAFLGSRSFLRDVLPMTPDDAAK